MKVGITGYKGFIGQHLLNHLKAKGFDIVLIERNAFDHLEGLDVIIHLSGENITKKRWNNTFKERIKSSRIDSTKKITEAILKLKIKPKVVLIASASGYYANAGQLTLIETSPNGHGFLSKTCQSWENAALPLKKAQIRSVFMRFCTVLGKDGGALSKMTLFFKMFLGSYFGKGDQIISWIHIHDLILAIEFLINNEKIEGPVNFSSPNPVSMKEFCKQLAKSIHRPCFISMPSFVVKLLFGEMGNELFLFSRKVYPKKLLDNGFKFSFENIKEAFNNLYK
jgi:uncharacterized protein (TIGR01777 family)